VQLYGHAVLGSVTRPVAQLLGYARVDLDAGESVRLTFSVPTARFAFTDRRMIKIVEPGDVEVWVAPHAAAGSVAQTAEASGGAIVSEKRAELRLLPGEATAKRTLAIIGEVYEVSTADARTVSVQQAEPERPAELVG
jgi:beta-glucosidase